MASSLAWLGVVMQLAKTLANSRPLGRIYASEKVDPFEKCCYRSCTAVIENSTSIDAKL